MLPRLLDLPKLLKKKSVLLLGPRATGKSHLIRTALPKARVYDLLKPREYARLLQRPELIEEELGDTRDLVVIDEVQKLPALLDLVHHLIESRGIRFLLTGSSARKLRRGHANLLAGRAWQASMHPLVAAEIPRFDLLRYLNRGGLPGIWLSEDPEEDLQSYVDTYLREEVHAEALTRRIDQFARFLDVIGLSSGQELAFEGISRDSGVQAKTVRNYVDVLTDTLLGFELPAFRETATRKAITRSKYYLFDVGVANCLARRFRIEPKSVAFGVAFEHFIVHEVRAHLSYARIREPLAYWRSTSQFEVDLLVGREVAMEVKATELVTPHDLRGLKALREERLFKRYMVVSLDARKRVLDGIEVWPWQAFLEALGQGALVG